MRDFTLSMECGRIGKENITMISRSIELKRYCSESLENIENYQDAVNDSENLWDCHHRLEIQGQFRNSVKLLKRCGMYWHRPASELIFLRKDEHQRLHHSGWRGKPRSSETRRKISESQKGKHLSEETKRKIGEAVRRKNVEKRRNGGAI